MLDNSTKIKSRPKNNFHCFEGTGRALWRAIAAGSDRASIKNSRDGYVIDLPKDADDFIERNGGISNPQETYIPNRQRYYRFVSSRRMNEKGQDGWVGRWWLHRGGFEHLIGVARLTGQPLAQVAQNYLCIPREWSDCGWVVEAELTVDLKAWTGKGNAAHGAISPASRLREKGDGRLYWAPGAIAPPQYLVPGSDEQIKNFFRRIWCKRTGIVDDFR